MTRFLPSNILPRAKSRAKSSSLRIANQLLSLIYARSLNHCIGNEGRIPWHLPDEFAHFQATTMGKSIIMGRKTYEDHNCELPGRLNIVISTQTDFLAAPGIEITHSLEAAIERAKGYSDECFVIGGVGLFTAALPIADNVYETIVEAKIAGDTVLPEFDFSDWNTTLLEQHSADLRHKYAFRIFHHFRSDH
ncbi:MAG: dihydrofolate reductase [Halioglobus sp.]